MWFYVWFIAPLEKNWRTNIKDLPSNVSLAIVTHHTSTIKTYKQQLWQDPPCYVAGNIHYKSMVIFHGIFQFAFSNSLPGRGHGMVEFRPKFPPINQGLLPSIPAIIHGLSPSHKTRRQKSQQPSCLIGRKLELQPYCLRQAVPSVISQGSNRVQSMIAATLLVSIYHDTNDTKAEKSLIKYLDLSIIVVNDG